MSDRCKYRTYRHRSGGKIDAAEMADSSVGAVAGEVVGPPRRPDPIPQASGR